MGGRRRAGWAMGLGGSWRARGPLNATFHPVRALPPEIASAQTRAAGSFPLALWTSASALQSRWGITACRLPAPELSKLWPWHRLSLSPHTLSCGRASHVPLSVSVIAPCSIGLCSRTTTVLPLPCAFCWLAIICDACCLIMRAVEPLSCRHAAASPSSTRRLRHRRTMQLAVSSRHIPDAVSA